MQTDTLNTELHKQSYHSAKQDVNRANSKRLAGLIGPTLMALSFTETLNLHIWAVNVAPVIYLDGTLIFIAGLAIIRIHNLWRGWPVLITLAGWITLLGGLYRMLAPEAKQAGDNFYTYIMFGVLFLVGVFLTYKAYVGPNSSRQDPI